MPRPATTPPMMSARPPTSLPRPSKTWDRNEGREDRPLEERDRGDAFQRSACRAERLREEPEDRDEPVDLELELRFEPEAEAPRLFGLVADISNKGYSEPVTAWCIGTHPRPVPTAYDRRRVRR